MKFVNLSGLATALDPPASREALRRIIREHKDFPVARRGGTGSEWLFDPAKVQRWWERHIQGRPRTRGNQVRHDQNGRTVRPGALPASTDSGGLSIGQRKTALETALLADRLKKERGELVELARLRAELESDIVEFRAALSNFPAAMARRLGLSAEQQTVMQEAMDRRLNMLADKLLSRSGAHGGGQS